VGAFEGLYVGPVGDVGGGTVGTAAGDQVLTTVGGTVGSAVNLLGHPAPDGIAAGGLALGTS